MDPTVESEDDSQVSCTSLNVCFHMEFCEFSLLYTYMYMGHVHVNHVHVHVCSEKLDRVLPVVFLKCTLVQRSCACTIALYSCVK